MADEALTQIARTEETREGAWGFSSFSASRLVASRARAFSDFTSNEEQMFMRKHTSIAIALAAVLAMAATPVFASWSDTAASNLVVGNGKLGEQAQPKIVQTIDNNY